MVHPSVTAPNFVSVTSSLGVLFSILRRGKVSTLWSSFFLSFMRFANFNIGLFPTVLFILLNQNRLLAIHLEEATEMNLHLQRSVSATESIETTEIVSLLSFQGGTRESLELDSKEIGRASCRERV